MSRILAARKWCAVTAATVLTALSVTGCSSAPERPASAGFDEGTRGEGSASNGTVHARLAPGPVRLVDRTPSRDVSASTTAPATAPATTTTKPASPAAPEPVDPRFRFTLSGAPMSFVDASKAAPAPSAADGYALESASLEPASLEPSAALQDDDEGEEEEEEKPWEIRFETAFSVTGGNTRESNLDVNLEGEYEWEDASLTGYARAEWGDAQNADGERQRNKNRQTAGAEYKKTIADPLYLFAKQDFERDEFKDIQLRSDSFIGAGTQLFKNDAHEVNGQIGPGYSITRRFSGEDETDYVSGLIKQDWTWQINEAWELVETFEFISNLEEVDDDFRTLLTGDLRTDITETIYLSLGVEHEYDAEPAADVGRQDFRFQVKIGAKF